MTNYSKLNKSQLLDELSKLQAENLQLEQANLLFLQGPVTVFKWSNKKGWQVEYVTPNVINIFGYSAEEFTSGEILYSRLIVPGDINRVIDEVEQASQDGVDRFDHEPYRVLHRDGTERWLRDHTTILRNDNNEITHYYGYIFDITGEKTSQINLDSDKFLAQSFLDNTNNLIAVKSPDGEYLQINKSFEECFHVHRDDVIGNTDYDLFPREQADIYRARDLRVQTEGFKTVFEEKFTFQDEQRNYISEKFPLYNLNNELFATCYIASDITRLKQAEDSLRFSKSLLSDTQAVTHMGNWSYNLSTGKSVWSEELYRLLGYPRSVEANQDNFLRAVHPEDRPLVYNAEVILHKSLGYKKSYHIGYRLQREDGEIRYVEEQVKISFDENNKPLRLFGTTLDITERKRVEISLLKVHDELKLKLDARSTDITALSHQIKEGVKQRIKSDTELIRHQRIFTEAIDIFSDGFILLDPDDVVVEYNQRFVECFPTLRDVIKPGIKYEELVRTTAERGQYKEAIGREDEWIAERMELHYQGTCCVEQPLTDGRWLLINDRKTSSGYMVGLRTEITEQKNREQKILLSEKRFRGIIDQLENIAIQGYNEDRNVIYWNKASEALYGFTNNEAIGKKLEDLIVPDQMRQALIDAVNNLVKNNIPIPAAELHLKHKDGSEVSVYSSHVFLKEVTGKAELFCVDVDKSLLYKSQKKLERANKEWEQTFNAVDAAIALIDTNCQIVKTNMSMREHLDRYDNLLFGEQCNECLYGDISPAEKCPHTKTQRDGLIHTEEINYQNVGEYFRVTTSPLYDENKKLLGSVYVAYNITDRKKAEENRLALMERQKDSLLKEVHHRIKNHLQGLLGLLQHRKNTSSAISSVIDEVAAQVESISVVHGLLGQKPGIQIHFLQMLEAIIYNAEGLGEMPIITCYAEERDRYNIDTEKAVAMALVINELVMNAVKHCQPAVKGIDEIRVTVKREENHIDLSITNPGDLPDGFDLDKGKSLGTGLELANIMLPSKGVKLTITQQGKEVVSKLMVYSPLLIDKPQ